MSITHSIEFTPPITQPERFATWSRDVQKVLDYLPLYIATGRKQRIFAIPWAEARGRSSPLIAEEFYEQHHLEPLILPNQQQAYEQFFQQLPVSIKYEELLQQLPGSAKVDGEQSQSRPVTSFPQAQDAISKLYGEGPYVFMTLDIPDKGIYCLVAIEQGGKEPLPIRGPDGTGEPIVTKTEVAFNIDVNTYEDGDAFWISLEYLLQENETSFSGYLIWKLGRDPHDIVVQAALMRLAYHFPEIIVHSDLQPVEWWEASLLCQKLFGVADLPPSILDPWDNRYKNEEARRQLIREANSLPDQ